MGLQTAQGCLYSFITVKKKCMQWLRVRAHHCFKGPYSERRKMWWTHVRPPVWGPSSQISNLCFKSPTTTQPTKSQARYPPHPQTVYIFPN